MEQKMNEENIENNLVFCIESLEAFAIKSIPRSGFRNTSHKNHNYMRIFYSGFFIKTMTKQTLYVNNFTRKSEFRLQFLRQSTFQNRHCWRGLMTSPIIFRMIAQIKWQTMRGWMPALFF